MILVARCKHCGTERQWERLPDGSVVPPATDVGAGDKRYPYPCRDASSEQCEPPRNAAEAAVQAALFADPVRVRELEVPGMQVASRVARELARGIGVRFSARGGGRSGKRR